MRRPKLTVLKTGSTLPGLLNRRGDFEDWIRQPLLQTGADVRVVDAQAGEPLPPPRRLDGVVVTGSPSMVSRREPWSEAAAEWLASLVVRGTPIPVLGICFGHQLLAHALGGEVGRNPAGREIGTVDVERLPAAADDPLFGALPNTFPAHVTHEESVLVLPADAVHLARSAGDRHQAFRWGPCAWGLQFHPEFNRAVMCDYLAGRRQLLRTEGLDPLALFRTSRETPQSHGLLTRFTQLCARADLG